MSKSEMGLLVSVPVAPGVHYIPDHCCHRRGPRGGLTLLFLTALLIAVSIQYWRLTVLILFSVGLVLVSGWRNQRRTARGLPVGPTIREWLQRWRRKP
jgi:hypothetical protein